MSSTAPNVPPPARTWCPGRVRLTASPNAVPAPCMLALGHGGPCNAATTVVENHNAPKRRGSK